MSDARAEGAIELDQSLSQTGLRLLLPSVAPEQRGQSFAGVLPSEWQGEVCQEGTRLPGRDVDGGATCDPGIEATK